MGSGKAKLRSGEVEPGNEPVNGTKTACSTFDDGEDAIEAFEDLTLNGYRTTYLDSQPSHRVAKKLRV